MPIYTTLQTALSFVNWHATVPQHLFSKVLSKDYVCFLLNKCSIQQQPQTALVSWALSSTVQVLKISLLPVLSKGLYPHR